MAVIFQSGYILPAGDAPLTHARIAHSSNWQNGANITASTTDSAYFAEGPDNTLTYEKWKPTATTGTWEADFTTSRTCDYAVIGAHTLGASLSTIKIQSWNGSSWDDETPATAITSDMPIFCIFAPKAATKWRLNITAGTNIPTVGVIKFGAALQMQRAIYGGHSPLDMARETMLRSNISETGEFLGRTKQRSHFKTSFQWQHLTADWVRDNWRTFQLAAEEEPFFIAWRPADFSEVGLCQTPNIGAPDNMGLRDFMSASVEVTAYGYD